MTQMYKDESLGKLVINREFKHQVFEGPSPLSLEKIGFTFKKRSKETLCGSRASLPQFHFTYNVN